MVDNIARTIFYDTEGEFLKINIVKIISDWEPENKKQNK